MQSCGEQRLQIKEGVVCALVKGAIAQNTADDEGADSGSSRLDSHLRGGDGIVWGGIGMDGSSLFVWLALRWAVGW
jgi:hypothetical protein